MSLCDHIREDAYECTQNAKWVFNLDDEPYIMIHSCNDHLHKLLPKTQTAYVGYVGDLKLDRI